MNQGKKSFARRSAPLKTQNRRVLPGLHGTICGAARTVRGMLRDSNAPHLALLQSYWRVRSRSCRNDRPARHEARVPSRWSSGFASISRNRPLPA
ncbi:hypothetical protein CUJ89_34090 [Burkholderia pyrrocinia]|uniref:Uncharacterized protein n=1 Tax=Burkholderia pyrrocinia TaxID=60550 RepID=A0A2Z5N944_BURPY|nr:hypothetical protein CUJ89_34090 [Burkholderia pyrrocinia]